MKNPLLQLSRPYVAVRGGNWDKNAGFIRVSFRRHDFRIIGLHQPGFRLFRTQEKK